MTLISEAPMLLSYLQSLSPPAVSTVLGASTSALSLAAVWAVGFALVRALKVRVR
jgi:hypothetical protein